MKKTMVLTGAAMLAAASLLLLAGCRNAATPPPVNDGNTGLLELTIEEQVIGRAILPDVDRDSFAQFRLDFTPADTSVLNQPFHVVWTSLPGAAIPLEVGSWNLRVTAFYDTVAGLGTFTPGAAFDAAAAVFDTATTSPATPIVVIAGESISRPVLLAPINRVLGTGTFSWNITFNAPISSASIVISEIDVPGTNAPNALDPIVLYAGGIAGNLNDTLTLATGSYNMLLTMQHYEGEVVTIPQYLRIYQNLVSTYAETFGDLHFPVTLLDFILRSWDDTSEVWNFTGRDIGAVHFHALDPPIAGIPDDDVLDDITGRLNSITADATTTLRRPTDHAELGQLIDAALIGHAIDTNRIDVALLANYAAIMAALRGFAVNVGAPLDTNVAIAQTEAVPGIVVMTVTIGAYQVVFTFNRITGDIAISGTPVGGFHRVGSVLTATPTLSGATGAVYLQWMRGGTNPIPDDSYAPTPAEIVADGSSVAYWATPGTTYTLAAADAYRFITVIGRRTGYFGTVTSTQVIGPIRQVQGPGTVTIEFTGFNGITYEGLDSISLSDQYRVYPTLTVTAATGTLSNITWNVGWSAAPIGNGSTLTLDEAVHDYRIGTHSITVRATINGVPYSRVIRFVVNP